MVLIETVTFINGLFLNIISKNEKEVDKMSCKWVEGVLAIIVIVFALWQTSASKVILVIAGALFLIHALSCRKCGGACYGGDNSEMMMKAPKRSTRKKKSSSRKKRR